MLDPANVNKTAWSGAQTVAEFAALRGFIDAGEPRALGAVAERVRGEPVLDIGVGGGRTVPLMRLLTDAYTAVDFAPAMVSACQRKYPEADVRHADARDLSQFEDGRFGFVFFSFSGIDAVGHDDRKRVLAEVRRVLRPNGWFVFSTHNQDGPSHREVPWRGRRFPGPGWYRAIRWTARLPIEAGRMSRSWKNWRQNRRLNVDGDGWSMRASAPHEFGIVIHYTTYAHQCAELREAGFEVFDVFDSQRGEHVSPTDVTSDVDAFHFVTRRP